MTGVSPFKLLRGRHPVSKLCPWWVKRKQGKECEDVSLEEFRKKVRCKQKKIKEIYDRKWKVKEPSFAIGDWVRIRKPDFVRKGASKFGRALKVVKVLRNSAVTQDGKVWNVRREAKSCGNGDYLDEGEGVDHLVARWSGFGNCGARSFVCVGSETDYEQSIAGEVSGEGVIADNQGNNKDIVLNKDSVASVVKSNART
ncbi:hypothetical protein NDU88_001175, partial [Pleurodeles waltl]